MAQAPAEFRERTGKRARCGATVARVQCTEGEHRAERDRRPAVAGREALGSLARARVAVPAGSVLTISGLAPWWLVGL
jgi:hypothetical protein